MALSLPGPETSDISRVPEHRIATPGENATPGDSIDALEIRPSPNFIVAVPIFLIFAIFSPITCVRLKRLLYKYVVEREKNDKTTEE